MGKLLKEKTQWYIGQPAAKPTFIIRKNKWLSAPNCRIEKSGLTRLTHAQKIVGSNPTSANFSILILKYFLFLFVK